MDKYEFNIKVEQIKKLVGKSDYKTAMKIADTIDWRRVRNTNLLSMVAMVYEKNEDYEEAKEILLLAYERAPIGKRLLYKLAELAIKEGNIDEAEAYYREFSDLAGEDPRQQLLRYLILKEKGAPAQQLIHSLESYTSAELDEKWLYELAELYSMAGMTGQCVETCDRIMLLFGLGKYVDKAMDLKTRYAPLSNYQRDLVENRDKYEAKLHAVEQEYGIGGPGDGPEPEDEYYEDGNMSEQIGYYGNGDAPEQQGYYEAGNAPGRGYYDEDNMPGQRGYNEEENISVQPKYDEDEYMSGPSGYDEDYNMPERPEYSEDEGMPEHPEYYEADIAVRLEEAAVRENLAREMSKISYQEPYLRPVPEMERTRVLDDIRRVGHPADWNSNEAEVSDMAGTSGTSGTFGAITAGPIAIGSTAAVTTAMAADKAAVTTATAITEAAVTTAMAATEAAVTTATAATEAVVTTATAATEAATTAATSAMAATEAAASAAFAGSLRTAGAPGRMVSAMPRPRGIVRMSTVEEDAAAISDEPVVGEAGMARAAVGGKLADQKADGEYDGPEYSSDLISKNNYPETGKEVPTLQAAEEWPEFEDIDGEEQEAEPPVLNHLMVEARTPEKGLKTAVDALKQIHLETGVKNPVARITGSKLSKKGVLASAEKLAGKDLVIEEAGDMTAEAVAELNELMSRDSSGMIVVLIDNPKQMEKLHQEQPVLARKFECIGTGEPPIEAEMAKPPTGKTPVIPLYADRKPVKEEPCQSDSYETSQYEADQHENGQYETDFHGDEPYEDSVPQEGKRGGFWKRKKPVYEELESEEIEPEPENSYEDDDYYVEEADTRAAARPDDGPGSHGEEMDIDEFAQYACRYANEIDCSITGKSMLALYERIEIMEEDGISLTRENAEDLIEEAADHAEKPSFGKRIKGIFSSKYDKDGLLILKEEHFIY